MEIFNPKDKEDVAIVAGLIVLLLFVAIGNIGMAFGNAVENKAYTAKYTQEEGNRYLSMVDTDVRQHITSVNVLDRRTVEGICGSFACVNINTYNGKPTDATIYISNNLDGTGHRFEEAFYHEVGHVEAAFKSGMKKAESQTYADNYKDKVLNR